MVSRSLITNMLIMLERYTEALPLSQIQSGRCPGNQGNQGKVRKNGKGLKWSGKVREFEKERGTSLKSQRIVTG